MRNKFRVLFLYPNEPFLNPPPVCIGILAAVLKENGFEVGLFDNTLYDNKAVTSDGKKLENLQVKPFAFKDRGIFPDKGNMLDDLRVKVASFKPDLIALSALEGTYAMGIQMLDAIRDFKVPVIAGGVYPTASAEDVLSNANISFVCVGEGEIALLELCKALEEGRDYTEIKNLWIKSSNGKIIKNSLNRVVDLDLMPIPDYGVFDPRRLYRPMGGSVYRTIPIETNRGCPFYCTFCNSPTIAELYHGNKIKSYFRKKSIKKIYQELKFLIHKWDAEYVYFSSDTFLAMSDPEFDEFVHMYSKFKLPFWIQTRAETVRSDKMKTLKKIGCYRMSIGLEHGNAGFRKKILKKGFSNDTFIKATKIINKAGIPLTVNNIIGFPFETRDLIFDTIELNRKIRFDTCNAYAFYPFRGTQLYELCRKNSFIPCDPPSLTCVTQGSILDMPGLSREDINGLMRTFVMYVKMPKKMWPEIKKAEKNDDKGNKKFNELRMTYMEKYS